MSGIETVPNPEEDSSESLDELKVEEPCQGQVLLFNGAGVRPAPPRTAEEIQYLIDANILPRPSPNESSTE